MNVNMQTVNLIPLKDLRLCSKTSGLCWNVIHDVYYNQENTTIRLVTINPQTHYLGYLWSIVMLLVLLLPLL